MPNGNSYLVLRLSEASSAVLGDLARLLESHPEHLLRDRDLGAVQADAGEAAVGGGAKPAPQSGGAAVGGGVKFDRQEDLHLTYVFFGEELRSASAGGLQALHDALVEFGAASPTRDAGSVAMQVTGFELFPPDKKNLVIARLGFASAADEIALRRLYLQIAQHVAPASGIAVRGEPAPPGEGGRAAQRAQSRPCGVGDLADASVLARSSHWQPHITLGKVRASKADVCSKVCEAQMNSRLLAALELACEQPAVTLDGFGMAGEVPKRLWKDWEVGFDGRSAG